MKKLLALILASLMIFALASCGNTENNETTDTSSSSTETTSGSETTGSETTGETTGSEETTGKPEEPETPASLEDIIDGIYEKCPVEIMVGTTVIDLTNAMSLKGATGIEASADKVEEACLSEAMIGSQAYSMAIVRVKDAADAESVANEMLNGIDQRKWICVYADEIRVAVCDDVIMLIMFDSALDLNIGDFVDAFSEVCGTEADPVLEK